MVISRFTVHDTHRLMLDEDRREMKLIEPGRMELEKQNSLQKVKHSKLYSELLKA